MTLRRSRKAGLDPIAAGVERVNNFETESGLNYRSDPPAAESRRDHGQPSDCLSATGLWPALGVRSLPIAPLKTLRDSHTSPQKASSSIMRSFPFSGDLSRPVSVIPAGEVAPWRTAQGGPGRPDPALPGGRRGSLRHGLRERWRASSSRSRCDGARGCTSGSSGGKSSAHPRLNRIAREIQGCISGS